MIAASRNEDQETTGPANTTVYGTTSDYPPGTPYTEMLVFYRQNARSPWTVQRWRPVLVAVAPVSRESPGHVFRRDPARDGRGTTQRCPTLQSNYSEVSAARDVVARHRVVILARRSALQRVGQCNVVSGQRGFVQRPPRGHDALRLGRRHGGKRSAEIEVGGKRLRRRR